jgi:hypothetical protein
MSNYITISEMVIVDIWQFLNIDRRFLSDMNDFYLNPGITRQKIDDDIGNKTASH